MPLPEGKKKKGYCKLIFGNENSEAIWVSQEIYFRKIKAKLLQNSSQSIVNNQIKDYFSLKPRYVWMVQSERPKFLLYCLFVISQGLSQPPFNPHPWQRLIIALQYLSFPLPFSNRTFPCFRHVSVHVMQRRHFSAPCGQRWITVNVLIIPAAD